MPTPSVLSGAQAKALRDQRNQARLSQSQRAAADNHGEQGVNVEPPPGVKVPDSSGIGHDMGGTPLEPPPGMKGASAYAARREQGRRAAGLPPAAVPTAAPPTAAPGASPSPVAPTAPPAVQHRAEPPAKPATPENPEHEGGGGPMPNPAELPPEHAAGEPPPFPPPHQEGVHDEGVHDEGVHDEGVHDEGVHPHGEPDPGMPPGHEPPGHPAATDEGIPPPAATEGARDEAWTDMMSEGEMEPQEGKPFQLGFALKKAGTADSRWAVEINDEPVGYIPLAAQSSAEVIRARFEDKNEYARAFMSRVKQDGFRKTFASCRGVLYRARLAKTDLAKKLEQEIRAKLDEEFTQRYAKLREQHVGMLLLADEAMRKNILHNGTMHPLKDSLVRAMSAEHHIRPDKVLATVERAMETCGDQAIRQASDKAAEWLQQPADFQEAVRKEIRASATKQVQRIPSASQPYDRMAALVAGSINLAIPSQQGGAASDDDARSAAEDARIIRASIGSL